MMDWNEKIASLKNNNARRDFLDTWNQWPLWVMVGQLGMFVHRLDLPDGTSLVASHYDGLTYRSPINGELVNRGPRIYIMHPGEKYQPGVNSTTSLVEHLTAVRKLILKGGGQDG